MPKWSPLVRCWLQVAQAKQPTWYTNSRARITNSEELMTLVQRAQRRWENSLREERGRGQSGQALGGGAWFKFISRNMV